MSGGDKLQEVLDGMQEAIFEICEEDTKDIVEDGTLSILDDMTLRFACNEYTIFYDEPLGEFLDDEIAYHVAHDEKGEPVASDDDSFLEALRDVLQARVATLDAILARPRVAECVTSEPHDDMGSQ